MGIFRSGQRRQFERLAKPLAKPLYYAALRLTRQTEWAEDLTQEALVRAYERFDLFTPGTNFRAWLFTILTHTYLNDCDRARRRPVTASMDTVDNDGAFWDFPDEEATSDPEAILLRTVLDEDVAAAFDALPDEFRNAVSLVDIDELTYLEAAEALRVPVGTVRSRVSRGRALMRQRLLKVGRQVGDGSADITGAGKG